MISNYKQYTIDIKLKEFEAEFYTVNEGLIGNLKDKIEKWISKNINSKDDLKKLIVSLVLNHSKKFALLVLSMMIISFGVAKNDVVAFIDSSDLDNAKKTELIKELSNVEKLGIDDDTYDFLTAIADRESSNNPDTTNKIGYIGKYQFGDIALQDVGIDTKEINYKKFKEDPKIWQEFEQDKAMIKLLKNNIKYLGDYYNKYDGKTINNIKITKSGMLGAAHLVGAKSVIKYLKSNGRIIRKDGNGTSLEEYLKLFQNYNVDKL